MVEKQAARCIPLPSQQFGCESEMKSLQYGAKIHVRSTVQSKKNNQSTTFIPFAEESLP